MRLIANNTKVIALFIAMSCLPAFAENAALTPKTVDEKTSYVIGLQLADQLQQTRSQTGFAPDLNLVIQALRDAAAGTPQLNQEQARQIHDAFIEKVRTQLEKAQQEQMERNQAEMKVLGEKNQAESTAYLAANLRKPGVRVTASGLQYTVLVEGKGRKPKETDTATINYRMTLTNGKEIENTTRTGHPALVTIPGAMKAWKEALPMMTEGSKWLLVIPPSLAYGDKQAGMIGPNSVILCEIELVKASNTSGDH